MSYPKDELGAWIRPMEQRFRALVAGAITVKQFLDPETWHVFEDRDVEEWALVQWDPSVVSLLAEGDGHTRDEAHAPWATGI